MSIAENFRRLRAEIPATVTIVLAAKTRSAGEVREAMAAGATDIGYNSVQEAAAMHASLGADAGRLRWHLIGHLQSNKINKVLPVFDAIQTVDSVELAAAIDRRITAADRVLPVLIEVNAAGEPGKSGVAADTAAVASLAAGIAAFPRLRLDGLMTMGPADASAEELRPYFRRTRELLDHLRRQNLPRASLNTLSMGMSDSYHVAIEEGATMVRLGTVVFGPRPALKA